MIIRVNVHKVYFERKVSNSIRFERLTMYRKFLVVRQPWERLVSAYRNKLEGPSGFSNKIRRRMLEDLYPGEHFDSPIITFPIFVHYILNIYFLQKWTLETNDWIMFTVSYSVRYLIYQPNIYEQPLILIIFFSYDYIAKYKTLTEDSNFVLNTIGAPKNLTFPSYQPTQTKDLVDKYFAQLSACQIARLIRLYKVDFQMFDYEIIYYHSRNCIETK